MTLLDHTERERRAVDDAPVTLERDAFARWLLLFSPDAIVGRALCPDECPLARYLAIKTGRPVEVDPDVWYTPGSIYDYDLPEWAKDFVHRVDAVEGAVSAHDAILALRTGETP